MAMNDSLRVKDPVAGTDVDLELAAGAGGKKRPVVHIDSGDGLPLPTNAAQETGGNLAGLVTQVGEVAASPTANTLLARLKDLLTGVVLAAGANHIGEVGGRSVTITGAVTRPADTTQYAAGDVIANSTSAPAVITFANCARLNAGSGVIIGAQVVDGANQTVLPTLELWLFDTTFTPDNDNAVFTPADAELLTLVGIIQFATWFVGDATAGAGGNAVSSGTLTNYLAFKCGAASAALFGILVVRNAYTPVSGEVFSVRLRILQD